MEQEQGEIEKSLLEQGAEILHGIGVWEGAPVRVERNAPEGGPAQMEGGWTYVRVEMRDGKPVALVAKTNPDKPGKRLVKYVSPERLRDWNQASAPSNMTGSEQLVVRDPMSGRADEAVKKDLRESLGDKETQ